MTDVVFADLARRISDCQSLSSFLGRAKVGAKEGHRGREDGGKSLSNGRWHVQGRFHAACKRGVSIFCPLSAGH